MNAGQTKIVGRMRLMGNFRWVILASALVWLQLVCCEEIEVESNHRQLVESFNIEKKCTYNGQPVCCGVIDPTATPGYPRTRSSKLHNEDRVRCHVKKQYFPSKYEEQHIKAAADLKSVPQKQVLDKLLDYMIADIPHSLKWLERVKEHSQSSVDLPVTDVDKEYLSYFNVTRTCSPLKGGEATSSSWIEWIEPITVHMRHPFSMYKCKSAARFTKEAIKVTPRRFTENADYVLVKLGKNVHDIAPHRHDHTAVSFPKHYFFDAGANNFLTGMAWFLCSYQQRGVVFDEIFGWEYTKYDPTSYWADVPPLIAPIYHFYNVPVLADNHTAHSVPRVIKELAREHDFVAFKLDIDTPSVEIPIARQLLSDPDLRELVDEFFFELHFQCEILSAKCGWEWPSDVVEGMRMDRITAMKFFQSLRHLGVRAHVWP